VEQESTRTVLQALREVVGRQGVFCALYCDRASHFFETPKAGGKIDPQRLTQVARALRELGIRTIPAYSPQIVLRARKITVLGAHLPCSHSDRNASLYRWANLGFQTKSYCRRPLESC
jgi:hypothetical protein